MTNLPIQTPSTDEPRTNFRTTLINLDRPGDPGVFDEQTRAEAKELIARYPEGQSRSALLPMLHLVQSVQGQVTPDGIAFCAEQLELTKAQVSAVSTFYTMYKRTPTGEYLVSVCTNTLCGVLGGDDIFAALKEGLGLGNSGGQTTPDGKITLEHAECLAACDYAPVVTVNYEFFDNQTVGSARNIVDELRSGQTPTPTRGAPLCTFRQIERQIAGFFDEQSLAPDAPTSGGPTEIGVKLAIERGDSAPSYAASSAGDSKPGASASTAAAGGAPTSGPGASASKAAAGGAPTSGPGASASKAAAGGAPTSGPGASANTAKKTSPQPTSAHDAPLKTAKSDAAHPKTGDTK